MKTLLQFLKRFSLLLQFLFLEAVAIIMLTQFNGYHRSVLLSSANWVSGFLFEGVDVVSDYFGLHEKNQDLSAENAALKNEIEYLRAQYETSVFSPDSMLVSIPDSSYWLPYRYLAAHIVQHSINKSQNYITLNKGTEDGVMPDMGVVASKGVVGIVKSASQHYAMVMPIINVQSRISCRLDSSQYFGSLQWDGTDYRYAVLHEVPSHVKVSRGEKVVTSGFSAIFPRDIPVGEVVDVTVKEKDQTLEIKVHLSVDFGKLSDVNVIHFAGMEEFNALQ